MNKAAKINVILIMRGVLRPSSTAIPRRRVAIVTNNNETDTH
jgi:hypothetical protein